MAERRHFKVEWSQVALGDVERLVGFLMAESPLRAEAIVDRIIARADSLTSTPSRGRAVPELRGVADTSWRELQEPPWRIIYQVQGNGVVTIHAVIDGRRDLQDVLLERLLSG